MTGVPRRTPNPCWKCAGLKAAITLCLAGGQDRQAH